MLSVRRFSSPSLLSGSKKLHSSWHIGVAAVPAGLPFNVAQLYMRMKAFAKEGP
jgi:hypothetical protein